MGVSKGTADIEFIKPEDASKAISEYNSMKAFNYILDAEIEGQAMIVTFRNQKGSETRTLGRKRITLRKNNNNNNNNNRGNGNNRRN